MIRRIPLAALPRPTALVAFAGTLLGSALGIPLSANAQEPLSSAFTYQGELANAGVPAVGIFDIRFRLYDDPFGGNQIGGVLCSDNLAIDAGRFAASLDFGAAAFNGQRRFLEIEVRQDTGLDCSDATGYTVLSPRQELTATPNAVFAQSAASATTANNATSLSGQPASFFSNAANLTGTLPSGRLSGTYTSALTLNNPANVFTGNGAGLTNLSAGNLVGTIDAARIPSLDASKIATGTLDPARIPVLDASRIATGTLANARTTGTNLNNANTLVLRDASGSFAAGTITAALNGTATNATQLGGQPTSFFTNASNLSTGTLDAARMPNNWAAGGDLAGSFPSPIIRPGAVGLQALTPSVRGVLSNVSSLVPAATPADAVGWGSSIGGLVNIPALPAGTSYVALSGGSVSSLALRSDGSVVAWGSNQFGQLSVPSLPPGTSYTAVATRFTHSLALRSDGLIVAWGENNNGQTDVPPLPAGVTYTAVAASIYYSVAVRSDGTIIAWGRDLSGLLSVPALPAGVTYTAVAAGDFHSLALRSDGSVVGWGDNGSGQLNVPALPLGVTYTAVAAGSGHSLALRSDGVVVGWGGNTAGQTNVPALPAGRTYTGVGAGQGFSLALRSDGVVVGWGRNVEGQLNVPALPVGMVYSAVAAGPFNGYALRGVPVAASLGTTVGLSVGSTTPPPASGGISVAGNSAFASGVTAQSFSGSGAGLTGLSASNITTGTLANARTTGTDASTPSSLVLRDASGNFAAGTITAALNGNAATATSATNATQLGGQPASFYTNASNITAGTLDAARVPSLDASKVTTGTLANARTTGTDASTPSTLVLRDASGNFAAGTITAALNGTAANATQLAGQPASFYTNASNINSGILANAQTTGTTASTPSTLVLRDASGNFSAGTITAALNGNATTATSAVTATSATTANNALQLNGLPASFYTSASNITTGTLPQSQVPDLDAAKITTGTLSNGRTTGTAAATTNTLVLRDATGNFAANTITATSFVGTLAGNATSASNSPQLNFQPASYYTNATNLVAGTLADARLSTNVPKLNASNTFSASSNAFAGNLLVGGTGIDNFAVGIDSQPGPRLGFVKKSGFNTQVTAAPTTPIVFSHTNQSDIFTNIGTATLTERLRIDPSGNVGINNNLPIQTLDVNGRIRVANGVIQRGSPAISTTSDLGLYSLVDGQWIRMVTTNAPFQWFTEPGPDGIGLTPRMTLNSAGLTVNGSLAKAGGSFKIDHPLDPENKYLYHSFVESPDMMNVYNGNITTDDRGYATVTLPDYFEALNRDFRYQLTIIDTANFALARISREISGGTFELATNLPNIKVSWQVTGIRKDAWAEKNRIPNAVDKPAAEKGTLLHPEAFAKPAAQGSN